MEAILKTELHINICLTNNLTDNFTMKLSLKINTVKKIVYALDGCGLIFTDVFFVPNSLQNIKAQKKLRQNYEHS